MLLHDFMARHGRVVLQFSAGKDSAACLKLLRPWIDKVIVLWCNQGAPYKETLEYMDKIKASVPCFIEVKGNQPEFIATHGYPADLVPFEGTELGNVASNAPYLISSIQDCCGTNLWAVLAKATLESGATGVIRGERQVDRLKSIIGPQSIHLDQEYLCPLYAWSEDDVISFLGVDIPESYKRGLQSSLDCTTCTAYLGHNPGRISDLQLADPKAFAEVVPVLLWLKEITIASLSNFSKV